MKRRFEPQNNSDKINLFKWKTPFELLCVHVGFLYKGTVMVKSSHKCKAAYELNNEWNVQRRYFPNSHGGFILQIAVNIHLRKFNPCEVRWKTSPGKDPHSQLVLIQTRNTKHYKLFCSHRAVHTDEPLSCRKTMNLLRGKTRGT